MSFDSEKNILKEKAKETIKKCIREYFDSFKVVPKLKKDPNGNIHFVRITTLNFKTK